MTTALITTRELFDLVGAVAVTASGAYLFDRLRRKDKLRRIEQKEREAEYARRHLRWDREKAEAERYFGGVVR